MKNNSKILVAVASGIVIGSALAVLFAPEKGSKTRKKISDAKNKLADTVKDTISKGQELFSEVKGKIKDKIEALN